MFSTVPTPNYLIIVHSVLVVFKLDLFYLSIVLQSMFYDGRKVCRSKHNSPDILFFLRVTGK